MMSMIQVDRLSAGSVFHFGCLAHLALAVPMFLLVGLIGASGRDAVTLNGQPVHGIGAVLVSLAMAMLFPLIPAAGLALGTLILRLLGDRAPSLRLRD